MQAIAGSPRDGHEGEYKRRCSNCKFLITWKGRYGDCPVCPNCGVAPTVKSLRKTVEAADKLIKKATENTGPR